VISLELREGRGKEEIEERETERKVEREWGSREVIYRDRHRDRDRDRDRSREETGASNFFDGGQ
jgi:hypothetical protein